MKRRTPSLKDVHKGIDEVRRRMLYAENAIEDAKEKLDEIIDLLNEERE